MICEPELTENSELLQLILRHKGVLVVLAEAYFDASGTHGAAKDLCLCGYIFTKDAALAFDQEWRAMLGRHGLPYFHMKECAHAAGVFSGLGHDGCDKAAREAIDIIKRHASQGVALSVDKSVGAALRKASPWMDEYSSWGKSSSPSGIGQRRISRALRCRACLRTEIAEPGWRLMPQGEY